MASALIRSSTSRVRDRLAVGRRGRRTPCRRGGGGCRAGVGDVAQAGGAGGLECPRREARPALSHRSPCGEWCPGRRRRKRSGCRVWAEPSAGLYRSETRRIREERHDGEPLGRTDDRDPGDDGVEQSGAERRAGRSRKPARDPARSASACGAIQAVTHGETRTSSPSTRGLRQPRVGLGRAAPARRVKNPDTLRMDERAVGLRPGVRHGGQADRRDLPRAVAAGQADVCAPAGDVLPEPEDQHPQRRRGVGRRGGRGRRRPRHQPDARRPAGVLREARGGGRRGPSPAAQGTALVDEASARLVPGERRTAGAGRACSRAAPSPIGQSACSLRKFSVGSPACSATSPRPPCCSASWASRPTPQAIGASPRGPALPVSDSSYVGSDVHLRRDLRDLRHRGPAEPVGVRPGRPDRRRGAQARRPVLGSRGPRSSGPATGARSSARSAGPAPPTRSPRTFSTTCTSGLAYRRRPLGLGGPRPHPHRDTPRRARCFRTLCVDQRQAGERAGGRPQRPVRRPR